MHFFSACLFLQFSGFTPPFHPGCALRVRDPHAPLPAPVWVSYEYLCRWIGCLEKSVCLCQVKNKNKKGCGLEDMSHWSCHVPLLHSFACLSSIPGWIFIPLHIFPPSSLLPSLLFILFLTFLNCSASSLSGCTALISFCLLHSLCSLSPLSKDGWLRVSALWIGTCKYLRIPFSAVFSQRHDRLTDPQQWEHMSPTKRRHVSPSTLQSLSFQHLINHRIVGWCVCVWQCEWPLRLIL